MKRNYSDFVTAVIVLLCSAVLLGALTVALSGYSLRNATRTMTIDFPDITGVRMHTEVRYAGAPAGEVTAFRHLTPEERSSAEGEQRKNAVRVTVEMRKDVPPLPEDVKVTLTSETMLSEKFIAISAGSPDVPMLAANVILQGYNNGNIDELFSAVGPALKSVRDLLASLEPVIQKAGETLDVVKVGVNDVMPKITKVADSAKMMAESADLLLKHTDRLITDNEGEIRANLQELRKSLEGVQKTLGSADKFVGNTDRELAERMKELEVVLQNLKVVTTHAKAVTETLGEKPSRLIWGGKANKLTSEREILRNDGPVPAKAKEPEPEKKERRGLFGR
jgi:ABC-type transporter Mla subunit MlaD